MNDIYFVSVCRIKEPSERRKYFTLWQQIRGSFRRSVHAAKKKQDYSVRSFFSNFKAYWDEYEEGEFPIDVRTWGFYADKNEAIKSVLENWTDMHECYYPYAIVETIPQGIMPISSEQLFFEWEKDSNAPWGGNYKQCDLPSEIKECFDTHRVNMSFVDIG